MPGRARIFGRSRIFGQAAQSVRTAFSPQQGRQFFAQHGKGQGFEQDEISPQVFAAPPVFRVKGGGVYDGFLQHRNGGMAEAHGLQHVKPAHVGHARVKNNQIPRALCQGGQSGLAVTRHVHARALSPQHMFHYVPVGLIVFGHKNAAAHKAAVL